MAPTKIVLSFSAIKARETDGEQLKGKPRQSAKAAKSIEIVKEKNRRNDLKLTTNPAIKRNLHTNIG